MCTVSFIPVGRKIFLTSSRDERRLRKPSSSPQPYNYPNCAILCPRDGQAGGTWISICENGNAAVLLNGAFIPHEKLGAYKKSRGLVFLDLMDAHYPLLKFLETSLVGIEPFTVILWQEHALYELRWDGTASKHSTRLPIQHPRIWSSVTLYDKSARQKREAWFEAWLRDYPRPKRHEIEQFHLLGGKADKHNSILLNRGQLSTVSITTLELSEESGRMIYRDCISGDTSEREIFFSE